MQVSVNPRDLKAELVALAECEVASDSPFLGGNRAIYLTWVAEYCELTRHVFPGVNTNRPASRDLDISTFDPISREYLIKVILYLAVSWYLGFSWQGTHLCPFDRMCGF